MRSSYVSYLLSLTATFAAALPAMDPTIQATAVVRLNGVHAVSVPLMLDKDSGAGNILLGNSIMDWTNVFTAHVEAGPDSVRCYLRGVDFTKERPFINYSRPIPAVVNVQCVARLYGVSDKEQDDLLMIEYIQSLRLTANQADNDARQPDQDSRTDIDQDDIDIRQKDDEIREELDNIKDSILADPNLAEADKERLRESYERFWSENPDNELNR